MLGHELNTCSYGAWLVGTRIYMYLIYMHLFYNPLLAAACFDQRRPPSVQARRSTVRQRARHREATINDQFTFKALPLSWLGLGSLEGRTTQVQMKRTLRGRGASGCVDDIIQGRMPPRRL